MKRIDVLKKRHERMLKKREALRSKALASTDAGEVRSINERIEEMNADIADVEDEIAAIEEEERAAQQQQENEQRSAPPANAQLVNGQAVAGFNMGANANQARENADPFATMEYRQAFMRYAQTG